MAIIEFSKIKKSYGDVRALDGVTLSIEEGTIYGLLGPNGAGKTTAVRVLTTLLKPDSGTATVAGFDVVSQANELRSVIGLAGQYSSVDENLTGYENLEMVGRLYRLSATFSKNRADELIEQFDLVEAADRPVRTYSGGMRRRLDLGAALVANPQVLFLDEPTTGLDPRSRLALWAFIEQLVSEGTTLLLTTQYLEEADRLADRIGVIDDGKIIAEGTADELKTQTGSDVVEARIGSEDNLEIARGILATIGTDIPRVQRGDLRIQVPVDGPGRVVEAVRRLDAAGVKIEDLALRRPTLDDVFLTLTGHGTDEIVTGQPPKKRRRRPERSAT